MMTTTDSQKNAERINIVYRSGAGVDSQDIELPFRVLVVGAFTNQLSDYDTEHPVSVNVNNLDDVIKSLNIVITISVVNRLHDNSSKHIEIEIPIESMHDFTPDGIVRKVPEIQELLEIHKLLQYLRDTHVDSDEAISLMHDMANKDRIVASLSRNGMGFLLGGPNGQDMGFLAPGAPAKALLWDNPQPLRSGLPAHSLWHWPQSDLWDSGFAEEETWERGWWAVTEPDILYSAAFVLALVSVR